MARAAREQASKIRLGIVGCGRAAEQCHIPAALTASDVELVAVVDSNSERLDYIVGSFRLSCLATTSHRELAGRVDAVLLPLPNDLHYSVSSEFLNLGVHVLCEKPLATTTREAGLLCELAEARGLTLGVGYMKRFEPNCELMKQLIDDEFLGRLDRFEFEYGTAGGWAPVSAYNLERERASGGVLTTNGCHLVDRMLCWFGYPCRVAFADDSHGGVEANCSALFAFDSGLTGEMRLSKTVSLSNRFRLYGERGCLEIGSSQHTSVTFFPVGRRGLKHEISEHPSREAPSETEYFQLQIEDFARAIRTRTPPRASGREGMASVALIEQCYETRTPLLESWVSNPLRQANRPGQGRHTHASTLQTDGINGTDGPVVVMAMSDNGSDQHRSARVLPYRGGSASIGSQPRTEGAVLITGATGFVGSRLCEVLYLGAAYQPRALVHSSGKAAYIARYPLEFVIGDLIDPSSVRRAMSGCSCVVHLARGSDRVMIEGLENVLRAAVDARVRRFVHVSSVAVYGDHPSPAAQWETAPAFKTGNPYGDIKLEQEKLVASYGKRFGLPYVILRPPHILGPYSHFVDAVIQRLRAGVLPILDGGVNVCNAVYIDNLIEAILLSLERPEAIGETFFVTDKERATWRECLEGFGSILGVEVPHASVDQLDPPVRSSTKDSVLQMSRVLLSQEFRSAVMALPAVGAVGRTLYRGYATLPEPQRKYLRSRLSPSALPPRRRPGSARYEAADYLIASQRRTVVHACDKAERLLGYTASVGYSTAMALTRDWLAFAKGDLNTVSRFRWTECRKAP